MPPRKRLSVFKRPKTIWEMISQRDWNSVMEFIVTEEGHKQAMEVDFTGLLTVLASAVSSQAPTAVVEALANINPPAVSAAGFLGQRPLHTACETGASLGVVRLLIKRFPDALIIPDERGKYPLHHAVERAVELNLDGDEKIAPNDGSARDGGSAGEVSSSGRGRPQREAGLALFLGEQSESAPSSLKTSKSSIEVARKVAWEAPSVIAIRDVMKRTPLDIANTGGNNVVVAEEVFSVLKVCASNHRHAIPRDILNMSFAPARKGVGASMTKSRWRIRRSSTAVVESLGNADDRGQDAIHKEPPSAAPWKLQQSPTHQQQQQQQPRRKTVTVERRKSNSEIEGSVRRSLQEDRVASSAAAYQAHLHSDKKSSPVSSPSTGPASSKNLHKSLPPGLSNTGASMRKPKERRRSTGTDRASNFNGVAPPEGSPGSLRRRHVQVSSRNERGGNGPTSSAPAGEPGFGGGAAASPDPLDMPGVFPENDLILSAKERRTPTVERKKGILSGMDSHNDAARGSFTVDEDSSGGRRGRNSSFMRSSRRVPGSAMQ